MIRDTDGIAERLLRWRTTRRWTESQAARALAVDRSTYVSWECGATPPDHQAIIVLARHEGSLPSRVRAESGLAPVWSVQNQVGIAGGFARSLKAWRLAEGLSQRRAAQILGVSAGAVEQWERGSVPGPALLARVATVWGLPLEEMRLLAGPDRVRRVETAGGAGSTPLSRARLAAGLTQGELGARLHVSSAALSRWECGLRRPHPADVMRIGAVLGLSQTEARQLFEGYPQVTRTGVGRLRGLRSLVLAYGWEPGSVANALGLDPVEVRSWIDGRRSVPAAFLDDLGVLLGQDLAGRIPELRVSAGRATERGSHPLARRRVVVGLSQAQLAARLGVARSTVASWETGRTPVPLRRLSSLCLALRWDRDTAELELGTGPTSMPDISADAAGGLGQAIAELRRRSGLSAAQLGRAVGVSGRTVRRWERGETRPGRLTVRRLAMAFGLHERQLRNLARSTAKASTGSALAG